MDPTLWAQAAGFLERRRPSGPYQTFVGKVSAYEFDPLRLLACHGNWYLLALNAAGPGRELRPVAFSAHRGAGQDLRPPAGLRCPRPHARQAFGSRAVRSP